MIAYFLMGRLSKSMELMTILSLAAVEFLIEAFAVIVLVLRVVFLQ